MADKLASMCPKAILKSLAHFLRADGAIGRNTMVLPELFVDNWARRIDMALVGPDLHAIEIKSARDNLDRLAGQVETMSRLFNKVTVCVASKHLAGLADLDSRVGIIEAVDTDGGIAFRVHRAAVFSEISDRRGLVHFLARPDIEAALKGAGVAIPARTFIYPLRDMAEKLPIEVLMEAAVSSLKRRFTPRSRQTKRKLLYGQGELVLQLP